MSGGVDVVGASIGRLVTKPDTASATLLGSAVVAADSGVVSTFGTWQEVLSATAAESYLVSVGLTVSGGITGTEGPVWVQVGIGAAGVEVLKWEDIPPFEATLTSRSTAVMRLAPFFRVTAGKRVAARIALGGTTSTRSFTVSLYGLPVTQTEGN